MKRDDLRVQLEQAVPEVPADFDAAMRRTLAGIVAEEGREKSRPISGRRLALLILVIALLLASAAVAAIRFEIFDSIFGAMPRNADQVMQGNLYQTTINDVEITIKEAGYDGMTLYLMYSYRMLDVDTPFGAGEGISEEAAQMLAEHNVGWWIDQLWFDGVSMDMPANSGGVTNGSEIPGEIIECQYWRLDNENVFLNGKVAISLPIGERQSLEDYYIGEHPEKYDAEGRTLLPEKGVVTFTLDATDMRAKVTEAEPNIIADLPDLTASVSKVSYTPIMMYITLKLDVKQEAMDAYIEANGEGMYFGENNDQLIPYSGMDVFSGWIGGLTLVDGKGQEVFTDMQSEYGFYFGNNGYGDHWAEYLFPYAESYPDEMWLAPRDMNGNIDMTLAVRVR